jgi:hypothetical protein
METINLFYSTTEDDVAARFRPIFEKVAQEVGSVLDVHFNRMYWREMAGGLSDTDGQAVIDKRIAGHYEIYLGIMGYRFGIKTEHEYRAAVESHSKTGTPICVFFGFCNEMVKPHSLDINSFRKVVRFKKEIGTPKKYGKAILYFDFADEEEFRSRVRTHLTQAARDVMGRVAGGRAFGLPPRGP